MIRPIKACLALALVGGISGISGCVDLEEQLVSSLGSSYIATPQGLNDATTAVYGQLQGWYGRGETDYTLTQLGTDTWSAGDQVSAGGAQNYIYLDDYSAPYNAFAAFHGALWGWGYGTIARANLVLSQGPGTPIGGSLTQAIKDSRLAEARFLRALAYFILVQHFGPLTVLPETSSGISTEAVRETEDSVYKVIIADLTDAVAKLPVTQPEYGRVTKGAAQHLLAEVYLNRAYREWNTANKQADFQQALTLATAVIGSGQYSLVPDFARLWCGTMRAGVPADPGGTGFCDLTNFAEKNSEVILSANYSYDTSQRGQTNYDHVEYLQRYDGDAAWAVGIDRDKDRGRPFRRLRPLPYTIELFRQTMYAGQTPGPTADIVDTRFRGSFQTVWHANKPGTNPAGTCPKCTSGTPIAGNVLRDPNGVLLGPGAGSDTAIAYFLYQVTDDFHRSKPYRIAVPCTKAVTEDCGKTSVTDPLAIFGDMHYPALKKFQDNKRTDVADINSGKDYPAFRLAETHLIAAEAAVGLNQGAVAAQHINVLRKRAACKGPPLCAVSHENDPAFMVTAGQMTLDFIMEERERETSGEHSRWMDIRRPGKEYFLNRIRTYNPYARPNIQDKHYLRPIPQQQINGITGTPYPQNPGW
jgi:hypothetical protein